MASQDKLTLYTYYRSSCSARLRIALYLKNLEFSPKYVNLIKSEQKAASYTTAINPSANVPTLIVTSPSGSEVKITQSVAALEYIEETYTEGVKLLPKDPAERAVVRSLAQIIASDVQPVTNLKILVKVQELGGDKVAYAKEKMTEGLKAYEAILATSARKYSVGDNVTMADVCLAPAVWGAQRFGVDFGELKRVMGVYGRLEEVEAFKKGHWNCQPDTPEELRGKNVQR